MRFRKINTSSVQKQWQSRSLARNPGFLPSRKNSQQDLYCKLTMSGFFLCKFQAREVVNIQNILFLRRLDGNPDKNLPVSITMFKKSSLQ